MNKNTTKRSITLHNNMLEQIEKLAYQNNINTSEQIRRFINEGLKIKGYRQDIDMIADIIRSEFNSIYRLEDIKQVLDSQANRLEKMISKIGKINCGQLFLLISMFLEIVEEDSHEKFDNILKKSMYNGIDYMQKQDYQINDFLRDIEQLKNISNKL